MEMKSVNVQNAGFVEENLYYPRIKRLTDGSLLMSFENDHFGWDIYVRRSEDNGKTWSDATLLVKSSPATSTAGEDTKVYVNPDFIQLADGIFYFALTFIFDIPIISYIIDLSSLPYFSSGEVSAS